MPTDGWDVLMSLAALLVLIGGGVYLYLGWWAEDRLREQEQQLEQQREALRQQLWRDHGVTWSATREATPRFSVDELPYK